VKKFIIERSLPGASNLSKEELLNIPQTFNELANEMETPYSWIQSFITEDKIYCIHVADSREAIREHSKIARFPLHTIHEVKTIIDPAAGSTEIISCLNQKNFYDRNNSQESVYSNGRLRNSGSVNSFNWIPFQRYQNKGGGV